MNAFQIPLYVTGAEETRPDDWSVNVCEGELSALLGTLVESCKQGFYRKDTLSVRSQSRWPGACCIV